VSKQVFFASIQGLRGIAASSVLGMHLYLMAVNGDYLPQGFSGRVGTCLGTLGHGVDLFFVISGFLIPASLKRHGDLTKFFIDRCLRILPLFVIIHVVVFSIGPFIGYKFFQGIGAFEYAKLFVANLLFLAPLFDVPLAQQNAWTLTYEWGFYITLGIAYFFYAQHPNRIAIALVLFFGAANLYFFPVTCYFVIGIIFAKTGFRVPFGKVNGLLLGLSATAILYLGNQYISTFVGIIPAAVLFAIVLDEESYLARFLKTRELQFAGKISYSLYLVHPLALFPYQMLFRYLAASGWNKLLLFILFAIFGTITAFVLATVSYYLIEDRLRKLLQRSWARPVVVSTGLHVHERKDEQIIG